MSPWRRACAGSPSRPCRPTAPYSDNTSVRGALRLARDLMERPSGRRPDQLRPIRFEPGFTRHAEGSVLAEFGETRVLCTASVEEGVPPFLRGQGQGWITAEYGMLPRATHTRTAREAARGQADRADPGDPAADRPVAACHGRI